MEKNPTIRTNRFMRNIVESPQSCNFSLYKIANLSTMCKKTVIEEQDRVLFVVIFTGFVAEEQKGFNIAGF
jgi:hypothetical protein